MDIRIFANDGTIGSFVDDEAFGFQHCPQPSPIGMAHVNAPFSRVLAAPLLFAFSRQQLSSARMVYEQEIHGLTPRVTGPHRRKKTKATQNRRFRQK